jgi:AcrR family transcriptional regulator
MTKKNRPENEKTTQTINDQDSRTAILIKVISLEVNKGHLKWKVSDLARLCGVSRSLVYYHFGRTKGEILGHCLQMVAEDYYGLSTEDAPGLFDERLREVLIQTRRVHLRHPEIAAFYQRWRSQPSPLRDQLIKYEKRFQQKLRKTYPHLTNAQVIAIHGIFHGLITAPFMNDDAVAEVAELIKSLKS